MRPERALPRRARAQPVQGDHLRQVGPARSRLRASGLRCPAPKGGYATCTGKIRGRAATVKVGYRASRGDVSGPTRYAAARLRSVSGRDAWSRRAPRRRCPPSSHALVADKLAYCRAPPPLTRTGRACIHRPSAPLDRRPRLVARGAALRGSAARGRAAPARPDPGDAARARHRHRRQALPPGLQVGDLQLRRRGVADPRPRVIDERPDDGRDAGDRPDRRLASRRRAGGRAALRRRGHPPPLALPEVRHVLAAARRRPARAARPEDGLLPGRPAARAARSARRRRPSRRAEYGERTAATTAPTCSRSRRASGSGTATTTGRSSRASSSTSRGCPPAATSSCIEPMRTARCARRRSTTTRRRC